MAETKKKTIASTTVQSVVEIPCGAEIKVDVRQWDEDCYVRNHYDEEEAGRYCVVMDFEGFDSGNNDEQRISVAAAKAIANMLLTVCEVAEAKEAAYRAINPVTTEKKTPRRRSNPK